MEVDVSLAGRSIFVFTDGNLLVFFRGEGAESTPEIFTLDLKITEITLGGFSVPHRIQQHVPLLCIERSLRPKIKYVAFFRDDQVGADVEGCCSVGLGARQAAHRQRSRLGLHIGRRVICKRILFYRVLDRRAVCVIFRDAAKRAGPTARRNEIHTGNLSCAAHQADRYFFGALRLVAFVVPRFDHGDVERRYRSRRLGKRGRAKPEYEAEDQGNA